MIILTREAFFQVQTKWIGEETINQEKQRTAMVMQRVQDTSVTMVKWHVAGTPYEVHDAKTAKQVVTKTRIISTTRTVNNGGLAYNESSTATVGKNKRWAATRNACK